MTTLHFLARDTDEINVVLGPGIYRAVFEGEGVVSEEPKEPDLFPALPAGQDAKTETTVLTARRIIGVLLKVEDHSIRRNAFAAAAVMMGYNDGRG